MKIFHMIAALALALASVALAQTPASAPAPAPAPEQAPAKAPEAAPAPADEVDTTPAQSAALAWLQLVDADSYGLSWDQGAAAFRAAVTREQWEKALAAVRGPLGPVRARKVRQMTYTRALPNAPPGEYVVIQFDTQFGERPSLETVTPMREKDGSWRVSGYFIR